MLLKTYAKRNISIAYKLGNIRRNYKDRNNYLDLFVDKIEGKQLNRGF